MLRIKKDAFGREAVIFDLKKIVKIEEVGYNRTDITFEDGSKLETRNTLNEIMEQIDDHKKAEDDIQKSLWEMINESFGHF